jgi:hypothetical protein
MLVHASKSGSGALPKKQIILDKLIIVAKQCFGKDVKTTNPIKDKQT